MTFRLTSMLVSLAAGVSIAAVVAAQPPQESNAVHERLARAIEQGEVSVVREYLDHGGDVNAAWRDTPAQIVRSLLARSIWGGPETGAAGREEIFFLLLARGADPRSIHGALQIPVHDGKLEIVRTLVARGVRPEANEAVLEAAFRSRNALMLDFVLSAGIGVSLDPSQLPVYFLTDDVARLLVPKYLTANTVTPIGNEACDVLRILHLLHSDQDGCEGARGPLWLHFVVTGNRTIVDHMIDHGADLQRRGEVAVEMPPRMASFSGLEIARARRDQKMTDLLKKAQAKR